MTIARDGANDGPTNMARDQTLLDAAERGEPGCRVYGWNGPWVSLGRFQSPERDLVSPIPWVLRPTGGKAVLHGHDVTVGLAMPLSVFVRPSLRIVYRAVALPIIAALRSCGVAASLGEDTRFSNTGPRTADCFAHISANDIVDERTGVKVCGCALRLTQTAVLVQASLPNGRPLVDAQSVIRNASAYSAEAWDASGFADALEEALKPASALLRA